MSKQPNITEEQLKKELKNGSKYKEIAYEYNYGYPSRQLARKIRDLGWTRNQKLSINDFGSANTSIPSEVVSELIQRNGLSDADNVYVVPEVNESGNLEFVPTRRQFRKPEVEEDE